jgi:cytochrome c peroxidase
MTSGSTRNARVARGAAFAASLVAAGALLVGVRAGASAFRRSTPAATSAPRIEPAKAPSATPGASSPNDGASTDAARIALGKRIFSDTNLSDPPGTSCASCHDPGRAFAGNHGSNNGVALGSRPAHFAKRNTPSVLYLRFVRKFHLHWEEDAPLVDAYGGFFWDGRVDSIAELTRQPLLNPDEMNGGDGTRVARVIGAATYASDFRSEFPGALDDPGATLQAIGDAVSAFLLSDAMAPFSSKYDDFVRGRAQLTEQEAAGLKLFKDSAKGGCSACHKMNDRSSDPQQSLFTDYSYDGVGAPRNRALPATRDPKYFDLGLCERKGADYAEKTEEFCGRFRTPSLRNVAVRAAFMHNGSFSRLRDVVAFYATRSTHPERWYKRGPEFDDLPAKYHDNVNVEKAPYNRHKGDAPALDDAEIDAIVAFLGTLTDAPYR